MKFKEIKSLSNEEKLSKLEDLKKELMKMRTQSARGTSPEKAGSIRVMKKNIAKLIKSYVGAN